jgi:hypothetical protein
MIGDRRGEGGNGTTEDDRKKTLDILLFICSLNARDTQREEGGEYHFFAIVQV